jgi:hypothetical protein
VPPLAALGVEYAAGWGGEELQTPIIERLRAKLSAAE